MRTAPTFSMRYAWPSGFCDARSTALASRIGGFVSRMSFCNCASVLLNSWLPSVTKSYPIGVERRDVRLALVFGRERRPVAVVADVHQPHRDPAPLLLGADLLRERRAPRDAPMSVRTFICSRSDPAGTTAG